MSCFLFLVQADTDPKTRQEFSLCESFLWHTYVLISRSTSLITLNNNNFYISDSCHLSLDPNTAFENLLLSEGNSKVTWIKKPQRYPDHPERFTKYEQVLCTEGLSGVCYWEVEWRGSRIEAAVCYKGAELEESGFGYTGQSWCISLSNYGCTFWHDGVKTKISTPCSSTLGVYLNHNAGCLSFYSVSGPGEMMLLHRVQTTFSQPLYPGFMVSRGGAVKIMSPKQKESTERFPE